LSRRNNNERLGAPHPDAPTPPLNNENDLFSFVSPTEFVDLPSGGKYYPPDHPLCDVDTIEIRHMTAKEEDILTSETLLKKGIAIDRLVQSVLVDKTIPPESFLVGDKNAILVASRITGFGPFYEVTFPCSACNEAIDHEIDLSLLELKETDTSDTELTESGTFMITLPATGINIELKLLTSQDEKSIARQLESRKSMKQPENAATLMLGSLIVSANGVTSRDQINKLTGLLPIKDSKYLRKVYDKIMPDLDMNIEFQCNNCAHGEKVVMPLTAAFFWPKQ